MAEQVLIALRREDRIEEMIPYLEKITKPGTRVVFLIPYLVDGLGWLVTQLATMQTEMQTVRATPKMADRFSWAGRQGAAQSLIRPVREALREQGVEVSADVYTGSLRKALRRYVANGEVGLILMRTGTRFRSLKNFATGAPFLGLFKRTGLPPVLVLRPSQEV